MNFWTAIVASLRPPRVLAAAIFCSTLSAGAGIGDVLGEGPVRLRMRIPERLLQDVRPGLPARLKTPGHPGTVFEGWVSRLPPERAPDDEAEARAAKKDPAIRPRAFYWLVAEFDDDAGRLRPGLSARVKVDCGRRSLAARMLRTGNRLLGGKLWLW